MSNDLIREKYLGRNDVFGLEYREGIVFFSVQSFEDTEYKPFSGLEDIEGGTSLDGGFQRLNDPDGDDILHLSKSDNSHKVIHAGIGMMPSQIRRFTRYAEGSSKLRTIPNLGTVSVSDPRAYVDGEDSPYDNPTDAEELVIPPGFHLGFDFYNPAVDDHEPLLNIDMRVYKVDILDPMSNRDVVRKAARPGGPAPIFLVGSLDSQESFNMENQWEVSPMSRKEVREEVLR